MDDTYMRFYEHEFYKKNKIVRDKVEQYFLQGKEYNFHWFNGRARIFYNSVIIEFIDRCKEGKENETGKHFKQYAKDVLDKHRMTTKEDLELYKYYFLTYTEIKKYFERNFYYNIIERAAIKIPTYELTGTYGEYHLVHIISELEEEEDEI
ncbi:hypothetical protein [Klebsiella quasipneumoniae]|uniref:hypothetical protein n=1 Tax=Klebsiella quasipneumoniae TaxID=1463165 RepID=UPI00352A0DA1